MDDLQMFDDLDRHLRRWQQRRFWSDMVLWLPRGLLAGLVAAAPVAALARYQPILYNREVAFLSLGLAWLALVLTTFVLLLRRPTLLKAAREFDRKLRLLERTSTAVEIRTGQLPVPSNMAAEQLDDAVRSAAAVDLQRQLPFRVRWLDLVTVVLAMLLLILAIVLPNPQTAILEAQQVLETSIAEQVARLESLQEVIRTAPSLEEAHRKAILQPLESALSQLGDDDLSREQVVAVLSESAAQLRELSQSPGTDELADALQSAGRPMANDQLGRSLTNGDLARAGQSLGQLADSLSSLPPGETAELAENLAAVADALDSVDQRLAGQMAEAARALQDNDLPAAQQALHEAAATLQQRGLEQSAAAQAQAAAELVQQSRAQVAAAGSTGTGEQAGVGGEANQDETGPGSGNQNQGAGSGISEGNSAGERAGEGDVAGGPGPGGGHAERVFVPEYADLNGEAGVEIELPAECLDNPARCGLLINETPTEFGDERSLVPYDQVFSDYRNAAYEALGRDYVPFGLKNFVKDYFSSLEP